jgi:anaerobic selenocysteine-containing dehydrogenase
MKVYLENGKITKITGEKINPNSQGKLCIKGLAAIELVYDASRLKYPLKRTKDGKWEKISWDEALNTIKEKFTSIIKEHGPNAIAWHRGTASRWGSNWSITQRFMNVLGSPNLATHDHICHTPREIAYNLTLGKMPICDWENSKCIILWASNPVETGLPTQIRKILKAKEKGAKIIVIDPFFTKTASKADIYLQPRPGTDGALALGMMNVIIKENLFDRDFVKKWTMGFEELKEYIKDYTPEKVEKITGILKEQIINLSRMYATLKPSSIHEGNGLDQHTNVVHTVRAVACLMALTGNLCVPGGNIITPSMGLNNISLRGRIIDAYSKSISTHPIYYNEPRIGLVSTVELIDSILSDQPYGIKALVVQASALGIIESNTTRVKKALEKIEFLVVHDLYMTATAKYADLVLPATSFLEDTLLITQQGPTVDTFFIGMINKVIEPMGEAVSDAEFIIRLAKKMGLDKEFNWNSPEDAFNEELRPLNLTVEKIREHPEGIVMPYKEDTYYRYKKFGFNTDTGKVNLYSNTLKMYEYDPIPTYKEPAESPYSTPELFKKYPLICSTGYKPGFFTHSRYRNLSILNKYMKNSVALINPVDAKRMNVIDNENIIIQSNRGKIEVKTKITYAIKEGMVLVSHGWGQPYSGGGTIANILTDDYERCPISGATGNRSFLCNIKKEG